MNIRNTLLLLGCILVGCGPSAEQKLELKLRFEQIHAIGDSLKDNEAQKEGFKNRLKMIKADLAAANDKMNTIKGFQLLRSSEEREAQIRNQFLVIENLKEEIDKIGEEIRLGEEELNRLKYRQKALESTL